MRRLVLVHGRGQDHKDADELKQEWIAALRGGLEVQGLHLPIGDDHIKFPYYGQLLFELVADARERVSDVVVRGPGADRREEAFLREVLAETVQAAGITQQQMLDYAAETRLERGGADHRWAQAALKAIDRHVPGASSVSIAVATRDVHRYLHRAGLRDVIETGVRAAMPAHSEMVVVAHSLGTIVAYNLLRREGREQGWQVPLLVTLGAPLAVSAIKRSLMPIGFPEVVTTWFNARDPRDLVALHALDGRGFPTEPPTENWDGVHNMTPNRHGISGYLGDPIVARRIHEGLTA